MKDEIWNGLGMIWLEYRPAFWTIVFVAFVLGAGIGSCS